MSLRTAIAIHNASLQFLVAVGLTALVLQGCPKKEPDPLIPRVYELPEDTGLHNLPDGEGLPDGE